MSTKTKELEFITALVTVRAQIITTTKNADSLIDHFAAVPKRLIDSMQMFDDCLNDINSSLMEMEVWYKASQTVNSYFDYRYLDMVLAVRKELDALKASIDKMRALRA